MIPNDALVNFDAEAVLSKLHGFQRDAVAYAYHRLFEASDSTRRFLIADEVGLGKTIIAKGILAKALEHLASRVSRIDVVYVCSNLAIAQQNITRLNPIPDLPVAKADRVTLLPLTMKGLASNRINFVAFTPGTSLDMGNALGKSNERRLLHAMLTRHWDLRGTSALNLLQGTVTNTERFRQRASEMAGVEVSPSIETAFFNELDKQPALRIEFEEACARFQRSREQIPPEDRQLRNRIVGKLRALLAKTCIGALEPDLIILDEFQRFKTLLAPDSEQGELARQLFDWSDEHSAARVLLLSATPYKAYTLQHEAAEDDHYADFLRTVAFLDNDAPTSERLRRLLEAHRAALFKIADSDSSDLDRIKNSIETHLRRVMSRTERLSAGASANGMLRSHVVDNLPVNATDLAAYPALRALSDALDVSDVMDYWKSAAYPLSFMEGYQLRAALSQRVDSARAALDLEPAVRRSFPALLPLKDIRRYRTLDPMQNARLRELVRQLDEQGAFDLLWLPPSLPYYAPSGPFHERRSLTKRLIFSAWQMVPRCIAALLSYECERRAFRADEDDPANTPEARKNRSALLRFSESEGRLTGMPVFSLLYPCTTLATLCDPRKRAAEASTDPPHPDAVLTWAIDRVREALPSEITYAEPGQQADETWYWAAPILLDAVQDQDGTSWWDQQDLERVWSEGGAEADEDGEIDKGWRRHFTTARQQAIDKQWPQGRAPHDLPQVLAKIGLAGPATCALRGFQRLFAPSSIEERCALRTAAAIVGRGFRSLFNRPETIALVRRGRRGEAYWALALTYCFEGCLSAVVDEWFHVLRYARGEFSTSPLKAAVALANNAAGALHVRTASLSVDDIHVDEVTRTPNLRTASMRSLFAMRFGSGKTEDEDRGQRDAAVREAFNSPFWPFVLVTTSVGQEGLDFHWYCHAIMHWNIPSNPVDLEQREGRVHRFKGHAIRRNVAAVHGRSALRSDRSDVWESAFELARQERSSGDQGLVPYWLYPLEGGAWIERHVLLYPHSSDAARYSALQRSLGAYRMVFGQPRQDELLAYLIHRIGPARLSELSDSLQIDLAPPRCEG